MPRGLVFALSFASVAFAPTVSLAANEECPDGWFCEASRRPPLPEPAAPGSARPSEPNAPPNRPPTSLGPPSEPGAPGGYPASAPAFSSYAEPSSEPWQPEFTPGVPPANAPLKRRGRGFREWGFNLHLAGALLSDPSESAAHLGMGGLGFGFRYRPTPPLAFELGVDLLKGKDERGFVRSEAALLFNTLLFFNPHDAVQVYGLAGLALSGANVNIAPRSDEAFFKRYDEHYSYFGGQLGLGVEVRVTRRLAIAGDLIGFIRGRTDDHWDDPPRNSERTDLCSSHASGGGLLRAGVTFYW